MPVTYGELLYDKGGILNQYKIKDRLYKKSLEVLDLFLFEEILNPII